MNDPDPIDVINYINDIFKNKNYDIQMCKRRNICRCEKKEECDCDTDLAYDVISAFFTFCSNCRCIFELNGMYEMKFKHPDGWKIFALHKETDEEIPLVILKNKKYKDGTPKCTIILKKDKKELKYELLERVYYNQRNVCFKLDYLKYS